MQNSGSKAHHSHANVDTYRGAEDDILFQMSVKSNGGKDLLMRSILEYQFFDKMDSNAKADLPQYY